MNKFLIAYILFSFFPVFSTPYSDDNLLAVVIMVKNEVDVIVPTLKPFVDAGIKSFFVYDTGSTDGTQDTVRNYFKEAGISQAHIIEEPFVDFATSRNRALDLAEQLFQAHTFLIMLDAEWYAYNVDELLAFCKAHKEYIAPGCTGSCYLTRLFTKQDAINNFVPRLIRRGYNVRYVGVVHEAIPDITSGIVTDIFYFEYAPQQIGKDKSKARFKRDYHLLKKHLESDPDDTRTLFYLGQTCQFLNEWEEAVFYYKKRLEFGPLSEEQYLAAYRIGYAIEFILEEADKNNTSCLYRWEDAMQYYLTAHNILPYRAEPLFRIACRYIRNNQHAIAYLFAIRAAQVPYPQRNSLFIEKRIYDHLRYDILGQCAIYAGEAEIGKAAVLKAMEVVPDDPCLHHNLALYNEFLSQYSVVA